MDKPFDPCLPWESTDCPPLAVLLDSAIEQARLTEMEEQADRFYQSLAGV